MLVLDESFDFPDLTTFHGDIITLSPMTNSNVLPSSNVLPNILNFTSKNATLDVPHISPSTNSIYYDFDSVNYT